MATPSPQRLAALVEHVAEELARSFLAGRTSRSDDTKTKKSQAKEKP